MNIAVLSNVNIEPIKRFLEPHFDKIYFSGYNQYLTELLNNNSELYNGPYDVLFLFLDGEELFKKYLYSITKFSTIKNEIKEIVSTLSQAIEMFLQKNQVIFVINTIILPPYKINTFLEKNSVYSFNDITLYFNNELKKIKQAHKNILLMDWESIILNYGYENIYDKRFWYLGRIKYNNKGFQIIDKNLIQLLNSFQGKIKKVLILDLDNTLWGGVIGEDGIDGIKLSEDGIGKVYRDFQFLIKGLKEQGVLLSIVSKNNFNDVKEMFDKHPMMVLQFDDFIIKKINWNNKVENIKEIAEELNLGLDSFVFIDDNPVERDIVRQYLPDVVVPDFPEEITDLPEWFIKNIIYNYFGRITLTEEDKVKSKQYKSNIQRAQLQKKLNMNDFIASLEIKLKFYVDDKRFIERTAQQTQKTNQFNLTTRRYTVVEIENFIKSKNHLVFNVEYEDKFGKEGIIGTAIIKIEGEKAYIDTFLMSCRVIGRKVEDKFLEFIIKYIKDNHSNIKKLIGEYIPTRKNIIVKDFYKHRNFKILETRADGICLYEYKLKE